MTWVPLKRLVDERRPVTYGIVLPGPNQDSGPMIIKGGDVKPDGLDPARLCRTTVEIESGYARSRVQPGDIVIAIRGGVGDTALVPANVAGANLTQDAARIAPRRDVDARWLHYSLRSSPVQMDVSARVTGATIRGLNIEALDEVQIPKPPLLSEQRAIADYLDTETARIDELISKKQQLTLLLEERWESQLIGLLQLDAGRVALQRLFEPTIGGSWGAEPGTAEVDAICVRGTDFDMGRLRVGQSCPVRAYTHSDLSSKALRAGDLIVEKSGGGDTQPVGRVVCFDGSGPAVPTNFAARLRPLPGSRPAYLAFLLNAAYRAGITRSWIKQTTGIQNLDLGGFLSEKVSLPSLSEQDELLVGLEWSVAELRSIGQRLTRQLGLLAEHRQALITAAVTGEFAVPGAA